MSISSKDAYVHAHEYFVALTTSNVAKIDTAGAESIDPVGSSVEETAFIRKFESGANFETAVVPEPMPPRDRERMVLPPALRFFWLIFVLYLNFTMALAIGGMMCVVLRVAYTFICDEAKKMGL